MTGESAIRATRRGVLALGGSALLAGCAGIGGSVFGDDPIVLDGAELRDIGEREAPTIPERVPVEIEGGFLDASRSRVDELLDSVPEPLGSEEIPNGAIRKDLSRHRGYAREALDRAEDAPTPFEELQALRDARRSARTLAAGWRVIDADLARADLLDSAEDVRSHVRTVRDRHEYVGDDPIRAVLLHERIEGLLQAARHIADVDRDHLDRTPENPVTVGELAGDLEVATAMADAATHLYGQFTESLETSRDLDPVFESAIETLLGEIETRADALPAMDGDPSSLVDRNVEETPAGWTLRRLYDRIRETDEVDEELSEGRPASAILLSGETLAYVGAFEAFRERVDGGEDFTVESAEDVTSIRDDAVSAIESALDDGTHPRLTRYTTGEFAGIVAYVDDDVSRVGDEVEATWLDREIGYYLVATYLARATPAASQTVANALTSS